MEDFVARYGLIALFLGAGIEGEPFALAGGVLAHRGWLSPTWAVLAAIGGSCCVDQGWFHLSRHFRESRLVRSIARRPAFARSTALIERHAVAFPLLFRFAYGLRAIAPVAIGVSRLPTRLFVPLNILAAILWGTLFTAIGYAAGPAFEAADARYGSTVTAVTIGLSLLVFLLAFRRGRS